MRRRITPLTLALATFVSIIPAAFSATPGNATQLTLTVTGEASQTPDIIIASLSYQKTDRKIASAQAGVNTAMSEALALVRGVAHVHATTGAYTVAPIDATPTNTAKQTGWHAEQSLSLRLSAQPQSNSAAALRKLVGTLQQHGFALEQIGTTLSPMAERAACANAIKDAVSQMQAEAKTTAIALGDHVASINKIDLTSQSPFHPMIMALRSAPAAPPQLEAALSHVQINLSATITLRGAVR